MILLDLLCSEPEIATSEEKRDKYTKCNSLQQKLEIINWISHNPIH